MFTTTAGTLPPLICDWCGATYQTVTDHKECPKEEAQKMKEQKMAETERKCKRGHPMVRRPTGKWVCNECGSLSARNRNAAKGNGHVAPPASSNGDSAAAVAPSDTNGSSESSWQPLRALVLLNEIDERMADLRAMIAGQENG